VFKTINPIEVNGFAANQPIYEENVGSNVGEISSVTVAPVHLDGLNAVIFPNPRSLK
jgi:hypothetical protein